MIQRQSCRLYYSAVNTLSNSTDSFVRLVLFQVVLGDGLPELICHECALHVDGWYKFKKQCQNSDATLRQYISRQHLDSENDVRHLHKSYTD